VTCQLSRRLAYMPVPLPPPPRAERMPHAAHVSDGRYQGQLRHLKREQRGSAAQAADAAQQLQTVTAAAAATVRHADRILVRRFGT
jgi:hypothetical protein